AASEGEVTIFFSWFARPCGEWQLIVAVGAGPRFELSVRRDPEERGVVLYMTAAPMFAHADAHRLRFDDVHDGPLILDHLRDFLGAHIRPAGPMQQEPDDGILFQRARLLEVGHRRRDEIA